MSQQLILVGGPMAEPQAIYKVKAGDWLRVHGVTPMQLVRLAGVGVSTAYKVAKNDPTVSMDILARVYNRLKAAGYEIREADCWEIL